MEDRKPQNARETNFVLADRGMITTVIATLKKIDVRGFESMDRLVGSVILLQDLLNQEPVKIDEDPGEEV